MKELSIEEKAKAYDEALEKARQLYAYPTTKPFISDLQDLFPELKESEDERIRKEIIAFLTYYHTGQGNSVKYDDGWIAWLEKQGEQKPAWSEEDKVNLEWVLNHIETNDIEWLDRVCNWLKSLKDRVLPQPKQEWSEEDEIMFRKAIITIDNARMDTGSQEYYQGICDWLTSLYQKLNKLM